MGAVFAWDGLQMAPWRDVINAFAVPEPCRPFVTRGHSTLEIESHVATELGIVDRRTTRHLVDFEGDSLRIGASLVAKLSMYANHAAYVGWIESTVQRPLEVWEHSDPKSKDQTARKHYFGAYVGPTGATSHLVVAAANGVLINGFRLDHVTTADGKRYGNLLRVGYNPAQPPHKMAKGAPFPVAPLPV